MLTAECENDILTAGFLNTLPKVSGNAVREEAFLQVDGDTLQELLLFRQRLASLLRLARVRRTASPDTVVHAFTDLLYSTSALIDHEQQ